jgi:hypothetical protein
MIGGAAVCLYHLTSISERMQKLATPFKESAEHNLTPCTFSTQPIQRITFLPSIHENDPISVTRLKQKNYTLRKQRLLQLMDFWLSNVLRRAVL